MVTPIPMAITATHNRRAFIPTRRVRAIAKHLRWEGTMYAWIALKNKSTRGMPGVPLMRFCPRTRESSTQFSCRGNAKQETVEIPEVLLALPHLWEAIGGGYLGA